MGAEIFHALRRQLSDAGHNTNVGDEGGFAPNLAIGRRGARLHHEGDREGRLQAGRRRDAGARPAPSTEFFKDGKYELEGEGKTLDAGGMVDYLADLVGRYPIVSIEDGMAEDDWDGWKALTEALGEQGPARRRRPVRHQSRAPGATASSKGIANAILVKVNQIGTLTETLEAVEMAQRAGYTAVMSHRSGETEDSTIADLAVATNCGQIKTGSLSRSDRLAKYNQLLRIEEELGAQARYAGRSVLRAIALTPQAACSRTAAVNRACGSRGYPSLP